MKKRSLRLLYLTISASLLAACTTEGVDPRGTYDPADPTPEAEPTVTADPTPVDIPEHPDSIDEDMPGVFYDEFAGSEIEGNGGYFIRAGRQVYYRVIAPEGMPDYSLFAEFLPDEKPEVASTLAVYDLDTDKWHDVMEVKGNGYMYACVNGLLLADGNGSINVYDPLGVTESKYCDGHSITDVSDDGSMVAVFTDGGYSVYKDQKQLYTASGLLEAYGFAGDQLIGVRVIDNDNKRFEFVSYSADGSETSMGTFVKPDSVYETWALPELIEFEPVGDHVYLTVGYYEGTGHFLSDWEGYEMQAGKDSSLKDIVETDENKSVEDFNEPKMLIDSESGEVSFFSVKTNTVGLSEGYYGDLVYYDSPFSAQVLSPYMIYENMYPQWCNLMLYSVVLDKTAFVITATGHYLPEQDIGWRTAYYPYSYDYIAVPFAGLSSGEEPGRNYLAMEYPKHAKLSDADALKRTDGWQCVSAEAEGEYISAEDDTFNRELGFNDDGTITLVVQDKHSGDFETYTLEPAEFEFYEDYPCYSLDRGNGEPEKWVIIAYIGDHLEFSVEWKYNDGTPGGCNYVFNPTEKLLR
ncbi:MAG: hypothetical protein IKR23_12310 [Lachnospiraceae bacterium]|nr:hypothetical protein [Lachnospiraceae bacterium]